MTLIFLTSVNTRSNSVEVSAVTPGLWFPMISSWYRWILCICEAKCTYHNPVFSLDLARNFPLWPFSIKQTAERHTENCCWDNKNLRRHSRCWELQYHLGLQNNVFHNCTEGWGYDRNSDSEKEEGKERFWLKPGDCYRGQQSCCHAINY